ncbi:MULTISPECIES: hypothetical protein [Rhodobacterales]|jgi:hypothetical protein|uniref:hypothetical protein n=1 Tax=Rhodobacterales TaxID=204455 RepID=UPI00237EF983|nr:hypothetical protein [Phaeobacter gallaeciensis]MDE4140977.1 hypothetical protein [Phaeobacter gallaeciensis]MDE4149422.1 hypothetical protein [Phaeobacter gallaeciensis]MDE4153385.1 hypothetical protein [Phaeobacter gallaeciensis]MDE4228774.1 hypothetical protein [Phaeobacter gallaeciensis]MDE4257849.1 hypothetical protein [Phaeobacter gallaeciensis]
MQVILHVGAHGTEEDRLLKTLLNNKEAAAKRGVAIPGPGKYRYLLKDCMGALLTGTPAPDSGEVLWDSILEQEHADRVILSNPHFFGSQRQALEGHNFYPEAEMRMGALARLFPEDQLEIHMGLRDPGSLLPTLLADASPQRVDQVLQSSDPVALRWSNLLLRLRTAVPDVPITVWCYEDMPLIWAQILRQMMGFNSEERISGGMDLLSSIMSTEGMKRLRAYLHEHRDMTEAHKQRVIAAFLGKYAIDEAIEEEIDLPGWTEDLMDTLSDLYEEDLEQIAQIPGVTLLSA